MKRLCDVCRGVYANNHSFKEHQRKTGHRQFVQNATKLENADVRNQNIGHYSYSLKGKNDFVSALSNYLLRTKMENLAMFIMSSKQRSPRLLRM